MAYKIVEFNDGLQIVPNNWLSSDGSSSYWPPSNYSQIKVNKLIATDCEPNTETWSTHSILQIFGSSDSYENGMLKLKQAQDYSDVETGSELDSKKRSRHKSSSMKANKKSLKMPCKHYIWQKAMSKKLSKITLKIESLQKQNDEIKTMLENVIKIRTNSNSYGYSDDELNELNIEFPLSDEIQLLEIESMMLNDKEFYSKMIMTLKALGGTDFTAIVNTILAKLMTNCLAIRYSFAGKRKKISFKETFPTVLKTIINVVRFHKPTSTHKEIHNQIGRWLVHAQLRKTRQETKQIDQ
ncbi:uncharacterized protein LOC132933769 isoform X1 [Metopolophium dirhodum]|uniref:uncharacterized protein LOC132933769 isoform X1 n=2 Tax=Metopolophium dirhodum TaxID=44670 RepID=UPI00298FF67C|nr:uncharacterized protein LOC132933769 isoform X1 [Metopolophium dirhodum]